jgi:16S rRNA processing protein RimM
VPEAPVRGEWLQAGRVGRPHGLDGSFLVAEANLALLRAVSEVKLSGAVRAIVRRAGHEQRPILRVEGCADREAAKALRGERLLVSRAAAPALADDEWWAEDLQGLRAVDGAVSVGVVRRMLAMPSCELLEIARESGETLLVPLVSDAVRAVDLHRGVVDVNLGFLGEH